MLALRIERPTVGWRFWIFWMLATFAGGLLFLLLSFPLNWIMANVQPLGGVPPAQLSERPLFLWMMLLGDALLGASLGLAQWLVLRTELKGMGWWIVATAAGFSLGRLFMFVNLPQMDALGPGKAILQYGLFPAIFQWLALRGRVYQAGWWILIALLGWPLAFLLTDLAYATRLYVEPFDLVSALLVPAAVSGAGMVWLLRRPIPSAIPF